MIMKNIMYLLVFSMFLFSSCGSSGSGNKSDQKAAGEEMTVTEENTETEEAEAAEIEKTKISDCDEFLNKYEAWVDDYLDLLEKFKKNPADPDLTQKYLKVTNELADWSQQWFKFIDCNDQEKYEKRYDAISEKVDKKLKELGYE
jgi:hypothetical protein